MILEQFPTKLCLAANIFQIGHETTLDLSEDRALLFLFSLVSHWIVLVSLRSLVNYLAHIDKYCLNITWASCIGQLKILASCIAHHHFPTSKGSVADITAAFTL